MQNAYLACERPWVPSTIPRRKASRILYPRRHVAVISLCLHGMPFFSEDALYNGIL